METSIQNNERLRLRKYFKNMRDSMETSLAHQLSAQISGQIQNWDIYQSAEKIYFYYPLGNEVSLLPVIDHALSSGRRIAFPKVHGTYMAFYEVRKLDELAQGCFHVMEPLSDGRCPVLWQDALCFVPGTAFDLAGGRFGYGRGYYDRYFAKKAGCTLAGCAYAGQITDKLPTGQWDQSMDYLISEQGIIDFSQSII